MPRKSPAGKNDKLLAGVRLFKSRNSIRDLSLRMGFSDSDYQNRIKARFNIGRPESNLFVNDLVEFTKESGDYSMINGLCAEVGLSQPAPINLDKNANINTEFLVATKALGEMAEQINVPRMSQNQVSKLVASVQTLTAAAMTIGYAAESRFGGMSMTMMFGDLATGALV